MEKPRTPEDWQLFTTSVSAGGPITQVALDTAAAALSAALERAEQAARAGLGAYEAYDKYVEPVAEEHDEVGAADTEPREVAMLYLLSITGEQP
jgi:hypothetical protein